MKSVRQFMSRISADLVQAGIAKFSPNRLPQRCYLTALNSVKIWSMMTFNERPRRHDLEGCAIEQGEASVSYAFPLHDMGLGGVSIKDFT